MKTKIFILIIFIIILTIFVLSLNKRETLIKTEVTIVTPTPTSLYNPLKEIKYDGSTDLKKELESINPEVLDSDFQK